MLNIYGILFYGTVFVGLIFIADAIVGFVRASRGIDDDAIARRLIEAGTIRRASTETQFDILRESDAKPWHRFVPFVERLNWLIGQSGTALPLDRVLIIMGGLAVGVFAVFLLVLPPRFLPFSLILSLSIGAAIVIAWLFKARADRRKKFEEQLPDAIDLIVRSLKVGHPLNSALGVIAEEMPEPIGTEFRIAYEEVTYGHDVASAFARMLERVPAPDLGYLTIAVQIQQETGGNLVESLSKLSVVIRDRFRMFRKVKAITAEGRFSAWLLSFFPLGIAGALQLVKPDYYSQVYDYPYFPHLVVATTLMLIVNLIAMRVMTTIKV